MVSFFFPSTDHCPCYCYCPCTVCNSLLSSLW
jgi:hypothetical protein